MKKSVIKKAMAWSTPDGGKVELSSGYPLAEAINLARFSLSDSELLSLSNEFQALIEKRKTEGTNN